MLIASSTLAGSLSKVATRAYMLASSCEAGRLPAYADQKDSVKRLEGVAGLVIGLVVLILAIGIGVWLTSSGDGGGAPTPAEQERQEREDSSGGSG